jgi:hypothetical protein
MKIAVVGGGIFGVTAAVIAARDGHQVDLYEAEEDLLQAASGINQYRLHRGYHYPRSGDTARSALLAEDSFLEEYREAVRKDADHLYALAREGSKVTGDEFLAFCNLHGLPYEKVSVPHLVTPEEVEFVVKVEEGRFDPHELRRLAWQKLKEEGVRVHVGTRATKETVETYDRVIVALYAATNTFMSELGEPVEEHQYEVCEKPIVALPKEAARAAIVVIDGPFMCVDPYGATTTHVLGNVVHALHAENVGNAPYVPDALQGYLNRGIIKNPTVTNFSAFIESGSKFLPFLKEARHIGSLYTVRNVLPNLHATDARPTMVTRHGERVIRIFSGKIGNSVLAAREAAALLRK